MKNVTLYLLASIAAIVLSCRKDAPVSETNPVGPPTEGAAASATSTTALPAPSHMIFVWLENKYYSQIIGSSSAPYINSLRSKGTLFTNDYAVTHPSYPNYIRFFSGASQGVTTNDCIDGTPFSSPNLFTKLQAAGKTFAWYSEDLPSEGSGVCKYDYYREKHNPTTIFSNVSPSANKPFSYFPSDYNQLENVVCITPNLLNDMHDGSISRGDSWVKDHLSGLVEWCRSNNSIFVVYWDEGSSSSNRIPVIAVGQDVKADYKLGTKYDHYNWTKTICALFGASTDWTSHLSDRSVISGCWK